MDPIALLLLRTPITFYPSPQLQHHSLGEHTGYSCQGNSKAKLWSSAHPSFSKSNPSATPFPLPPPCPQLSPSSALLEPTDHLSPHILPLLTALSLPTAPVGTLFKHIGPPAREAHRLTTDLHLAFRFSKT